MAILAETSEILKKKNTVVVYRKAKKEDLRQVKELYKATAAQKGGISRTPQEITDEYINRIVFDSIKVGIMMLAVENNKVVGSVHAIKFEQQCLSHLLSNLTFVIHPAHQGKGIGKALFSAFIDHISLYMPEVIRVELFVRKSNEKAIRLYESCGFEIEGYLRQRIQTSDGIPETDVVMSWIRPS